MYPYVLLVLLSIICLMLDRKTSKLFGVLPYVAMAVFSGVRYDVAVDYQNYIYVYNSIKVSGAYDIEIGYVGLVKFIQAIGGTQQLVFLIFASLNSFFIYLFFRKKSLDFALSTFLYLCLAPFYLSSFNTMREALAVAIFLYATTFLNHSNFKYIILVLFATVFHRSAALFLLLPIFENLFKKNYILKTLIFLVVSIVIFRFGLLSLLNNYFSEHQYNTYSLSKITPVYLVFATIFAIFLFLADKKKIQFENYEVTMCSYTIVLILTGSIVDFYGTIFARFISYGSIFFPIFICYFIREFNSNTRKLINSAAYFFSFGYYIYALLTSQKMLPYKNNFLFFDNSQSNFIFISLILLLGCLVLLVIGSKRKKENSNKVFC